MPALGAVSFIFYTQGAKAPYVAIHTSVRFRYPCTATEVAQEYIDIMGKTGRGAIGAPGTEETNKSTRRMPRLSEAKKDAASCEKPRSGAHSRLTRGSPNGTTHLREQVS